MGLTIAIARTFDLIFLILFISILFSWIPNINWYNEPFKSLRIFSEFFFAPFRKFIPPIGMVDISPIAAFVVLNILKILLINIFSKLGL